MMSSGSDYGAIEITVKKKKKAEREMMRPNQSINRGKKSSSLKSEIVKLISYNCGDGVGFKCTRLKQIRCFIRLLFALLRNESLA